MSAEAFRAAVAEILQTASGGDLGRARTLAENLLEQQPGSPAVLCLLGRICRMQGALDDAAAHLERAAAAGPGMPQATAELGHLAVARGDPATAMAHFGELVRRQPERGDAWYNLARAAEDAGRWRTAVDAWRQAVRTTTEGRAEILARLGLALAVTGEADAAQRAHEEALEVDAGCVEAHFGLGLLAAGRGDFDEARASFRRALSHRPDFVDALQQLVESRRVDSTDDPDLERLRRITKRATTTPRDREVAHFALGKGWDDLEDYERAFHHYAEANALKKARLPAFDRAAWSRHIDELKACFAEPWQLRLPAAEPAPVPVFLVGTPRSGTTLAEQILTRHPGVEGLGENPFFDGAAQGALAPWPRPAADLPADTLAAVRDGYLDLLRTAGQAGHVTNKYPANFLHVGLLAALFPEAVFVHCQRDAADAALSIFFQDFPVGNVYANDLDDIDAYVDGYRDLMAHWAGQLGPRIVALGYEALVADPEGETRRLVAAVGLPWDDACLDASAGSSVATLSRWQVRQPVYSRSAGRAEHYAGVAGRPGERPR